MRTTAEVVVIGSGAFGASVAFHLAAQGQRDVVLLDKFGIASQTSPRAAGLTKQVRQTPELTKLAMRSVAKIVNFVEETGESIEFFQSGSINIARTEENVPQIDEEIAEGQALGLDIRRIDGAELSALTPFARADGILDMWFTPSDLFLEPVQIPRSYAAAAEKRGVELLPSTPVSGIRIERGRVAGVETNKGFISAPVVVDAAGAWARAVVQLAGINIPIQPVRHQLMITEPIAGVAKSQPICRIIDANVYIRPEQGGLMMGGYEPDPLAFDGASLAPDFQIADLPLDLAPLRRLADSVKTQFPIFQTTKVKTFRGGLPTMTADGNHIVGAIPGIARLFTACGCCVGGLSIAPAVGEALAELILTGRSTYSMEELDIRRFGPGLESDEAILAAGHTRTPITTRHHGVLACTGIEVERDGN